MGKTLAGLVVGILLAGAAILILGRTSEDAVDSTGSLEERPSPNLPEPAGEPAESAAPDASNLENESQAEPLEQSSAVTSGSSDEINVRSASALPSSDFEIEFRSMNMGRYENGLYLPQILAAEPRDEGWANGTESFLEAEVFGATAAPMTKVETECRTTWCGVVIEVPEGLPRDDVRAMYLRIMESVGSNESDSRAYTFGRPTDSGGHIVFYFHVDR